MSAVSLVLLIAVSLLSSIGYVQLRGAYERVDNALGQAQQAEAEAVTAKRKAEASERREAALRQSEQEQRLREAEQRQRAEAALRVAMESLNELFAQIESNRRPGQRLAADGTLTFRAGPDYEAPGDAGTDNTYNVTVSIEDAAGNTASQNVARITGATSP